MIVLQVFLGALIIYGIVCLIMYFIQHRLVFEGTEEHVGSPSDYSLVYEDVWLESRHNNKVHGWFVPCEESKGSILLCHGNYGNISHRLETLKIFNDLGFDVFIFDYQGYGKSTGMASEADVYYDSEQALKYLMKKTGKEASELIFFGRSLGGGPATYLAEQYKPKQLILESTFLTIPDVGAKIYWFLPIKLLSRVKFANIDRVKAISCPVLHIHSPDDELIPFDHAKELHAQSGSEHDIIEIKGDHGRGFLETGESYIEALRHFLNGTLEKKVCKT